MREICPTSHPIISLSFLLLSSLCFFSSSFFSFLFFCFHFIAISINLSIPSLISYHIVMRRWSPYLPTLHIHTYGGWGFLCCDQPSSQPAFPFLYVGRAVRPSNIIMKANQIKSNLTGIDFQQIESSMMGEACVRLACACGCGRWDVSIYLFVLDDSCSSHELWK